MLIHSYLKLLAGLAVTKLGTCAVCSCLIQLAAQLQLFDAGSGYRITVKHSSYECQSEKRIHVKTSA